jgi:hypothetical protein
MTAKQVKAKTIAACSKAELSKPCPTGGDGRGPAERLNAEVGIFLRKAEIAPILIGDGEPRSPWPRSMGRSGKSWGRSGAESAQTVRNTTLERTRDFLFESAVTH